MMAQADDHLARGGASVAVLNRLEGWEANLIVNLRLWCEGPSGMSEVWKDYTRVFRNPDAMAELRTFDALVQVLVENAARPLVRHSVECACVGSDECVFLNLVKTASDGHLGDAALIATLLAGPAQAESIAMLAGQVGETARKILPAETHNAVADGANVIQLH